MRRWLCNEQYTTESSACGRLIHAPAKRFRGVTDVAAGGFGGDMHALRRGEGGCMPEELLAEKARNEAVLAATKATGVDAELLSMMAGDAPEEIGWLWNSGILTGNQTVCLATFRCLAP